MEYPIWKVDSIKFQDFVKPVTKVPEAVDLGVSMLWAPWNIGAEDASSKGFLFGWGNPDPDNHSTELKYFPTPVVKSNIIMTEHDVAQYYWGGLWHMPTVEDFNELLAKCDWTWDAAKYAYKVSNRNDATKFIFLPATDFALGENVGDEDAGFYWTGVVSKDSAQYFMFPSAKESFTDEVRFDGFRAKRFAVRPVYGEYKIPITIFSKAAVLQNHNNVLIPYTIEGEGQNVEYGLLYSKMPNVAYATAEKIVLNLPTLETSYTGNFSLEELDFDTKYYYRTYAKSGDDLFVESEDHSFTTDKDERLVDLGLSVKWARWNIGAEKETDYGYLVPWGADNKNATAYVGNDQPNISGTPLDIAHNEWGSEWRMPTREEIKELYENCKVTSEYNNGVFGVRFSRRGESLFLPYGGLGKETDRKYEGVAAYLWSSENIGGYVAYGYLISTPGTDYAFEESEAQKVNGRSIRAVFGVNNKDNFKPDDQGGDDPVTPGGDDPVTPGGDDPVTPGGDDPQPGDTPEDVVAVDLGLTSGTLWANMNVGASHPYDSGYYYAWGETEEKSDHNYMLDYYKYWSADGGYQKIGKASGSTYELAGLTEYDPATKDWGSIWCMPTLKQMNELVEECTWEWVADNANYEYVPGYLIKSKKNSNSIFLPAVSYYSGKSKGSFGKGRYWTSSYYLPDDLRRHAWALSIEKDGAIQTLYDLRQYGMPVRPVRSK